MKKSKILMLGLAALAMTACNKNDEPVANENDATVSVRVMPGALRADAAQPAEGAEVGTQEEQKIKDLTLCIYNGQVQEGFGESASEDVKEVKDVKCSTGAKTIYVVANAKSLGLKGLTLDAFQKKTADLAQDNLIMSAEIDNFDIKAGKNFIGYTDNSSTVAGNYQKVNEPVKLYRINAKIELKKTDVAFAGVYEKYGLDFADGEIFVNLARVNSLLVGTDLAATTEKIYGYGTGLVSEKNFGTGFWTNALADGTYTAKPELQSEYTDKGEKSFYVFENNDGKNYPTMLVIKARLVKSNGDDLDEEDLKVAKSAGWIAQKASAKEAYTYYPIRINHFDKDAGYNAPTGKAVPASEKQDNIFRNTIYRLSGLKLTKPGIDNPNKKVESAMLSVTCVVAPWNVVEQEVEW